jgi:predicted restriction endonuclease
MTIWLKAAINEFNVSKAFEKLGKIDWAINHHIKKHDIVYLYMGRPVQKIIFKTLCIDDNVPPSQMVDDSKYMRQASNSKLTQRNSKKLIRLIPIINFEKELSNEFSLHTLVDNGMARSYVRDTRKLDNKPSLLEYIQRVEEELNIRKIESDLSIEIPTTEKERIVKTRIGQGLFKQKLLQRSQQCCICGLSNDLPLIASHIKPWKDSDSNERLDINNGFLFCPNHDALFDMGFISFQNDGRILISKNISDETRNLLNIKTTQSIRVIEQQSKYLSWHREKIFR